jgi:electron transfer flavoprotein beta subunit
MQIFVLLKMVPDVVEELVIGKDGKSLDEDAIRYKLNEWDEHALEEAVLLKEKYGGSITALALDAPDVEEALFLALAKGANQAVKISSEYKGWQTAVVANLFSSFLSSRGGSFTNETIVLTGSQAIDDVEGELGACLSELLKLPYISVVTGLSVDAGTKTATALKEFSGGLRGEFTVPLPAVIGIQSASKPPRYVPIAKVNAAKKTAKIESVSLPTPAVKSTLSIRKIFTPVAAGKAEMLEGSPKDISARIIEIITQRGIL